MLTPLMAEDELALLTVTAWDAAMVVAMPIIASTG
jgi:hypothetical protein